MDMGDPLGLRPRLHDGERGRHAVRRLDVRRAEHVVRVGHRLVEQEVRAAVDEHREDLELLGHRPERRRVARGRDAAEEVDLLRQLQTAQLLDVRVGARGLVRLQQLDLALAEQSAGGVDLLRRELLALEHRLAEDRGRSREERHVTDLERRVRNVALRCALSMRDADRREDAGDGGERRSHPHAEPG